MRLAAFLYAYPPHRMAGADLMSQHLLDALTEAGHTVGVFTSTVEPDRVEGQVQVRHKSCFRRTSGWQAIYAHPDLGDDPARWARRLHIPYIAVVHNVSPQTTRWLRKHPPTLTVWNSHATRKAHGGLAGLVVRSPLLVEDHATTRGDAITLVNLNRMKGVWQFRDLAVVNPGRSFLGVRGGWGVQQDNCLPVNVEVVGPVPHPMCDVWRRTRVLVMPSELESWGRVALEAACSGIPTVAHPTAGLREALGGAGLFADRAAPGQWVEAVRRLDDPGVYEEQSVLSLARAREVAGYRLGDVGGFLAAVASLHPCYTSGVGFTARREGM